MSPVPRRSSRTRDRPSMTTSIALINARSRPTRDCRRLVLLSQRIRRRRAGPGYFAAACRAMSGHAAAFLNAHLGLPVGKGEAPPVQTKQCGSGEQAGKDAKPVA